MLENTVKYFDFLKQYGFSDLIEYQYVREIRRDYIKDNIIISIAYEGNYWVDFIKTKSIFPSLATGASKLKDLDFKDTQSYDLTVLDTKNIIYDAIDIDHEDEKNLWYYSSLLKNNPEILNGDLAKFSLTSRFLKQVGIIK